MFAICVKSFFTHQIRPKPDAATRTDVAGRILKLVLAFNCSDKRLNNRTLLIKFQGIQYCKYQ